MHSTGLYIDMDNWDGYGLNITLYGKYPFQMNRQLTLYPLAGLGYDMMFYNKNEYGPEDTRKGLEGKDTLYLRIGGGLNYYFSEHLRFNAKLLYNIHLYSEVAADFDEYSVHGPGLSLGVSYVF